MKKIKLIAAALGYCLHMIIFELIPLYIYLGLQVVLTGYYFLLTYCKGLGREAIELAKEINHELSEDALRNKLNAMCDKLNAASLRDRNE